jgi:NTP pyrophosphatase (non-canonical NTP hydrolase)
MDLREYQNEGAKTDQVPEGKEYNMIVPLLGLAGETGSLLTEYKKYLRDKDAYRIFNERIAEELGDILWYVANIATKFGLDLDEIAKNNLTKIRGRWQNIQDTNSPQSARHLLFDDAFPSKEQLPRQFEVTIQEFQADQSVRIVLSMGDEQIGDELTDNAYVDDGYRFHDAFHLSYAALLGWSPVMRKLMGRKRKSDRQVDEVEDGGRAAVIDEAIAALVFEYAKGRAFLEGVERVDYELLRDIKNLTSHLEVSQRSMYEWERAILEGFKVWRQLKDNRGGIVIGDLLAGTIDYKPLA